MKHSICIIYTTNYKLIDPAFHVDEVATIADCNNCNTTEKLPALFGTISSSELLSARASTFYDIRNVKKETIGMYASGSDRSSSFPYRVEKEGV